MEKYLLDKRVVLWGTVDVSGTLTNFTMKATQGEAERVDASDKGSSTDKEFLTGLRGDKKTAWELEVNDVAGGSAEIWDVVLGESATITDLPEGKVQGKPKITLTACVVSEAPNISGTYKDKASVRMAGYSFSTPSTGTYNSAA